MGKRLFLYGVGEEPGDGEIHIRFSYKEFKESESMEEFIKETPYLVAENVDEIDLSKLDLPGDPKDYKAIINQNYLIVYKPHDYDEENIRIDEIIDICNAVGESVKSIVIDSSKVSGGEEDYYYNKVTQMLLDRYDEIKYPNKIKCRKDRQSADDDHIADLATVKMADELMDYIVYDIAKNDFSDLEKIIAMTIITSKLVHPNWENYYNTKVVGSDLYDSIYTNSIICAGYVDIFKRLANRLGIEAKDNPLVAGVRENDAGGHATVITTINDDKYNVHGNYFIDVSAIANIFDKKGIDGINYYENLIFPKVLDARIFGRGKEDLDKYDDIFGGIAAYKKYKDIFASLSDEKEEYEPYTEDIEEKSIPLDIIKQAADYVQSKYIFDLNDRKRTR